MVGLSTRDVVGVFSVLVDPIFSHGQRCLRWVGYPAGDRCIDDRGGKVLHGGGVPDREAGKALGAPRPVNSG